MAADDAYQASRQRIIDKLNSPEMVERVAERIAQQGVSETDAVDFSKEAIAAVLEGI